VEGFVHGHDPHGGFLALVRHNRLMADAAPRGKLPVMKNNSLLKDEIMLKVLYPPKYLSKFTRNHPDHWVMIWSSLVDFCHNLTPLVRVRQGIRGQTF